MIRPTARYFTLFTILLSLWGCGPKSAKLQKSVVPPDKTLFETGSDYLGKGQYIRARLAFQTLMNTYPDSDMAADAVLAIGDSYYDEGGTENLLQAEDQYKNFIVFFPTHPKAPDAALKIIAANARMMHAPDRDQSNSYKALDSVKKFLAQFPDSDYVPIAKQYQANFEETLALADLGVGEFYESKGNLAGARGRYQEIKEKYTSFSQMDEVLYRLAGIQEKSNNPDEAAINYSKIMSAYPFSKHADESKARLNSLGKPIPPVDTELAAANQARIKQPEGFSPLKPFIEFGKALGFLAPPDLYQQARKAVAEEKAKTAVAAAPGTTGEGGQTGGDIQIQSTIRKSADGKTEDTTILAPASANQPSSQDKKKETNKTIKKRNVKKPS